MKKRKLIQLKVILLLLIYLFSNIPTNLFHQHESEVPSYENATACEKSIYYSSKDGSCKHKSHLSEETEKCALCDKHLVSPHLFQLIFEKYFKKELVRDYFQATEGFYFQTSSSTSNRGPPSVSFYIF